MKDIIVGTDNQFQQQRKLQRHGIIEVLIINYDRKATHQEELRQQKEGSTEAIITLNIFR
jgi:hypothetical protein